MANKWEVARQRAQDPLGRNAALGIAGQTQSSARSALPNMFEQAQRSAQQAQGVVDQRAKEAELLKQLQEGGGRLVYDVGGAERAKDLNDPMQMAREQASSAYESSLRTRGDQISEMERLMGQLAPGAVSTGQQAQLRQNQMDLARAQSQAAGRVGLNRALAAKIAQRNQSQIAGRGQEAYQQRGLEDYQTNLARMGELAAGLGSADVAQGSAISGQSANALRQKYLGLQNDRARKLQQALADSQGYWAKQAAIAGKPPDPKWYETALRVGGQVGGAIVGGLTGGPGGAAAGTAAGGALADQAV